MMILSKLDHLEIIVATAFVLHAAGTAFGVPGCPEGDLRDLAHAIVGIDHDPTGGGDIDQGK